MARHRDGRPERGGHGRDIGKRVADQQRHLSVNADQRGLRNAVQAQHPDAGDDMVRSLRLHPPCSERWRERVDQTEDKHHSLLRVLVSVEPVRWPIGIEVALHGGEVMGGKATKGGRPGLSGQTRQH